ncbi:MAG: PHP domain-containing protein [archaeon]|nr:PHP domain-containing protein [archaeon]
MKLDLHTHSHYSHDSITKPETVIKKSKELGITFAITDHNTATAWPKLKEISRKENIPIIFGEEIMTYNNEKKFGEIIGLFLQQEIKPKNFAEVIDEIKSQDGLVVIPHPFDSFRHNFKAIDLIKHKIDLFEVFNARCYLNSFNSKALAFAKSSNFVQSAGSDSHTPQEYGNAFIEVEAFSLEEARKKLLKGQSKVFGKPAGIIPHIKTLLAKKNLLKDE